MHMFTGQQAEKQHKAGTGLRLDPIYMAAIFLQRHTQGWKLRLYVLKMYLCNFTAFQVISN